MANFRQTQPSIDLSKLAGGWAPAVTETLAEKLEGLLLAMVPTGTDTRTGQDGKPLTVTNTMIWDITNKEPRLIGRAVPISWQVVRTQLAKATPDNPWIVGRIKQAGRAYVLDGPKADEIAGIAKKIDGILAALPLVLTAETVTDEEPF